MGANTGISLSGIACDCKPINDEACVLSYWLRDASTQLLYHEIKDSLLLGRPSMATSGRRL